MKENITDKENQLKQLVNIICNNPKNRAFGLNWRYTPTGIQQYINDAGQKKKEILINSIPKDKREDFKENAICYPCFTSEYSLNKEYINKSTDYYIHLIFDCLFFDLDNDENPREAILELIKVCLFLEQELGITPLANLSGGKGGQINVLTEPLNDYLQELGVGFDEIKKAIGLYLIDKLDLKYLDENVYARGVRRLKRIPTSRHNKTGFYAHFFPYHDDRAINNYLDMGLIELNPWELVKKDKSYYVPQLPNKKNNTFGVKKLIKNSLPYLDEKAAATTKQDGISKYYTPPTADYVEYYEKPTDYDKLKEYMHRLYKHSTAEALTVRLIGTFKRADIPKKSAWDFFEDLDKNAEGNTHHKTNYYNKVIKKKINRIYKINLDDPKNSSRVFGKTGLLNIIDDLAADEVEANEIKNYIAQLFTIKPKDLEKVNLFNNECTVQLMDTTKEKYLIYNGLFKDINLKLDFKTKIAKLIYTKEAKNHDILIFEFSYKNKFFKISKQDIAAIQNILKLFDVKLEKDFSKTFTMIIRTNLSNLPAEATEPKQWTLEQKLNFYFKTRNRIDYARKELAKFLNEKLGVILRKSINKPYILNKNTNGYDGLEVDDLMTILAATGQFEQNSISDLDIKHALTFVKDRVKPKYNYVKFNNLVYDIDNFEVVKNLDKPILTLIEIPHNYNPQAKGEKIDNIIKDWLREPGDTLEQLELKLKHFKEFIAYLLTSGNNYKGLIAWFIIVGIGGAGKSLLNKIIELILGSENVGHLELQQLTPSNRFASSNLKNRLVNITTDGSKETIDDDSQIKAITGGDPVEIEPKGKQNELLPSEEVPKLVTIGNFLPPFKNGYDDPKLERIILFEFKNKIRGNKEAIEGKPKENKNLFNELKQDEQEIEYLIYSSIEALKDMVTNGRDFGAKISKEKLLKLLMKHENPISYFLLDLVEYDENNDDHTPIFAKDLNQVILKIAEREGVNIEHKDKNNLIKSRHLLNKIKYTFEINETAIKYKTLADQKHHQKPYNKTRRYPYLKGTPLYFETLREIYPNYKTTPEEQENTD